METKETTGRLSLVTKLAYGAGDTSSAIISAIGGFYLMDFLINVAGVRPGAAGNIFLIAKIWDAVNDPFVGWLSDRTTSRWGRRRPWLLFAALPLGLFFFLEWVVPPFNETFKFWYYLVIALLLDTAFTAMLVPYTALTAELTPDYDERTRLSSVRMGFSILGGVLAAFCHGLLVAQFKTDPRLGYALSAGIWAIVVVVPCLITVWGTREPPASARAAAPPALGFLAGLKIVFRNRAFILVTVIYMLSWLALQFAQNNLRIYTRDWIKLDMQWFSFILLAIQLSSFVWVFIWAKVSERLGKKRVYYLGALFFVGALLGLFFLQPGQVSWAFGLATLAGVGISVAYLVPWSMMPDVVEQDELETGQRREGIFYGFFVLLQKLGVALGMFISGWALELNGYIPATPGLPDPTQPASALLAVRVLIGPASAFIMLLSLVAVYLYPITREKHARLRAELEKRRQAAECQARK